MTHGSAESTLALRTRAQASTFSTILDRATAPSFAAIGYRATFCRERVRTTLGAAQIDFDKRRIPLSVSVGVASLACCGESASSDDLVGRADERLYAAKRGGRNRSVGAVPRS
jgi:GGDEF domain-containing protein